MSAPSSWQTWATVGTTESGALSDELLFAERQLRVILADELIGYAGFDLPDGGERCLRIDDDDVELLYAVCLRRPAGCLQDCLEIRFRDQSPPVEWDAL
jgi:hypothetical protein